MQLKDRLKKITPKYIHDIYNRTISKLLIQRRLGKWFDVEWKNKASTISQREWSDVYDEARNNWGGPDLAPQDIEKIRELLILDGSVVDIGCGNGFFLKHFDSVSDDLTGVDISKVALLKAKTNLPKNEKFVQAFMENLPFKDKAFDNVVTMHTLEHILDLQAGISELKRITAKKLIILVPSQEFSSYSEDYHLQYFPEESTLLSAVGVRNAKCIKYSNPPGEHNYSGEILLLWAEL